MARQQNLLFEKIEVFSHTNHRLRELLREWSEYEVQEMASTVNELVLTLAPLQFLCPIVASTERVTDVGSPEGHVKEEGG